MQKNNTRVVRKPTSPRQTQPTSPRSKSVKPVKKKKLVQNTFDLIQFKKMIGKGLVLPYKHGGCQIDIGTKNKILSKEFKSVAITGFVNGGIIYIFDGIDRLLAINSISYAEIKKTDLDIDVIVNQYFNLQVGDL